MVKPQHIVSILLVFLAACQETKVLSSRPPASPSSLPPEATQQRPESTQVQSSPSPPASEISAATSTLFDIPWDDRRPFAAGLIAAEQAALQELPGATIYHLDIQLDESLALVQGRQDFYYTNQETVPLSEIYLHLFPNLLGGELLVSGLKVAGEMATPLYAYQKSVMQVPLANPLLPGEGVTVQLAFETHVPVESERNYGIFSTVDGILALAHFYPMVAVYDDAGWHIEPPVPYGDVVYADTSFFLVRVSAKANVVIVASGIEIEREIAGDNQIVTYAAGPMRDFYLAGSERFHRTDSQVGDTELHSYAPAELTDGAATALETAAAALSSFGERFGQYPYTELDIVSTPTLALGVEYPGIFANAIRMYDPAEETAGLPNTVILESVTAHETGHQWFYGVIGNDQLNEPWLDESLTQYVTWLYYIDRYGRSNASGYYQSLLDRWGRVEPADIPIGMPVSAYEADAYSPIVYGRGPVFLNKLAETVGQERFDAFLREYYSTFHWEIATTKGFKLLLEKQCACDLTPLFEEWVYAR